MQQRLLRERRFDRWVDFWEKEGFWREQALSSQSIAERHNIEV
jgi:hypothetical protein